MKRAIAAKGRKGSPPLPRQRRALRLVQVTLIGVTLALMWMAFDAWLRYSGQELAEGTVRLDEVVGLSTASLLFLVLALWMGLRTVRGPEPPSLD